MSPPTLGPPYELNKTRRPGSSLRTVAELIDSQHRCGSGQFHKDLDVVIEGGAGRVGGA